jgi:hypothetical protein
MNSANVSDAISAPIQDLLQVFKEHLSSVMFPDVSFEILEALIKKVASNTNELQEALAKVEAVRADLELNNNELLQKAVRGLAYARIYAEGNGPLLEQLSKITIGKPVRVQKKSPAQKPSPADEAPVINEKSDDKKPAKHSRKSEAPFAAPPKE